MIAKQGRPWEKHPRNYVVFYDWEFEIRVREKTVTNRRPDPKNYGHDRYLGTGKLCVDVDNEYAKWIDGRKPLEDKVDLVADYLIRHLNKLRVGWAELRERERQREAAEEEALRRRREDDGYENVLARILELHQRMATELSKLPRRLPSAQEMERVRGPSTPDGPPVH
ncbi:MAG TPA: hypothetical protein VJZ71_20360 [Phycisphaerae bacterium]|nr:hypothetical protein [Phycisphaerae bacterium]